MAGAAASAAKAALSLPKGKFALHPLLPGAAQLLNQACTGRITPSWRLHTEGLLENWGKLGMCMPRYLEFREKLSRKDIKRAHIFMNEAAQAKLGEFYLCCALHLRPEAIESAGMDSEKLMQVANACATEDVEPFFEACRDFVKGYDEGLHKLLDQTTVWREVDDSLFWHHSFELTAPHKYADYRERLLPPEASWPDKEDAAGIEAVLTRGEAELAQESSTARAAADDTYELFLEACKTPVQANIRTALIDHGVIMGEVRYRGAE